MNRKTIAISAAAATLAAVLAGAAVAREHGGHGGHNDPFGDRTVTRAEVQSHASNMFAEHDLNKDGKLDDAERTAMHDERVAERFAILDLNKDGSITLAEMKAAKPQGRHGHGGHRGHRMSK